MEQVESYYFDTNILTPLNALITFLLEKDIDIDYFKNAKSGKKFKKLVLKNFSEHFDVDVLYRGYKILKFLNKLNNNNIEFYTSNICNWEIKTGFLEKQANENLIKMGVPFRLRKGGRFIGRMYYKNLAINDFKLLEENLKSINNYLSDQFSIEINPVENKNDISMNEIIDISEIIIAHSYIEIPDLWILSVGLITTPDYLVTNDQLFIEILSKISKPSDEWWENIRNEIINIITSYSFIKPEKVKIPRLIENI